ncbi:metallophosphoesterase family protein [candidate division KSB1 bacterium]|nr:metallophosphoesterase family protein [candidate division KSB1 bacterium]
MMIQDNLTRLFQEAPEMEITGRDDIVIFSDLHMGNGTARDDFKKNSKLFKHILTDYYLKKNYTLFLNGDIEELQKFSYEKIARKWKSVYDILDEFKGRNTLYRIIGNHDFELTNMNHHKYEHDILPAIKLKYDGQTLFVYHGHQASAYLEKHHKVASFVLRYLAKPLHIKNRSTAYDSKRKFRVERQVYKFSARKKIVSIIGHTHRPLFESLSKIDYLKFKIEQLCRNYLAADDNEKKVIEHYIKYFKQELHHSYTKKKDRALTSGLYDSHTVVPCLFNSGCVIGKRGITAIEISNKKIYLVYWFDKKRGKKYLKQQNGQNPEQLGDTPFFRKVLKEDHLNYVFTRIKLLT